MLSMRNEIRSAALASSRAALRARGTWRRRLLATARDVSAIAAILTGVICARILPGAFQALALVGAIAMIAVLVAPGVTRRRLVAGVGGWLCARLGLDAASMARARRSQTASSRAQSACEAFARVALALAVDATQRLCAMRLSTVGAISTTTQPRIATSLVLVFAVHCAA